MDFLNKIERAREHLTSWQEEWGDDFKYPIGNFSTENSETGQESIFLGKHEHRHILDYLATKGYLEISDTKGDVVRIKMLPKAVPTITLKTLELIARDLKDYFTGASIVALLKEAGVDPRLIVYPQSKWLVLYAVFKELALSKDKKDRELLFKVIADALHPLNFAGNIGLSSGLQEKFNKYLEYDGIVVAYSGHDKKYYVYKESEIAMENEEMNQLLNEELFQQEYDELEFLRQPENREKIATLRKAYQTLINIVAMFCENPSRPIGKLNDAYMKCKELVTKIVTDLRLYDSKKVHRLSTYSLPFNTLFNAEKYYIQNTQVLSWNTIRPEMYATYSDIEEIYRKANGTDILSEPDVQQMFSDISLLISKTKEENQKQREQRREMAYKPPLHQKDATTSSAGATTDTQDELSVQTQHGVLTLNKSTGTLKFNNTNGTLNPTSQEFKLLLKLMTSKNHQANYGALVTGPVSKVSKRSLTFIVRNLKETLGILPANKAKNRDIIGNVKNLGYKLLI